MNVEDVSPVKPPEEIYKPETTDTANKTNREEENTENQNTETQTNEVPNDNTTEEYTPYNVNLLA